MTQATWLALHTRSLTAVALFALLLAPAPAQQAPQSQGQQGRQQVKAMLLPQAVVLPVGDRKIDIDGSLIDWPKLPAMQLNDPRHAVARLSCMRDKLHQEASGSPKGKKI